MTYSQAAVASVKETDSMAHFIGFIPVQNPKKSNQALHAMLEIQVATVNIHLREMQYIQHFPMQQCIMH